MDTTRLEHIGNCETTVQSIMASRNMTYVNDLTLPKQKKSKSRGKVIIRAEQVNYSNDDVKFKAKITGLTSKKGIFCCFSNDPFVFIERARKMESKEFVRIE